MCIQFLYSVCQKVRSKSRRILILFEEKKSILKAIHYHTLYALFRKSCAVFTIYFLCQMHHTYRLWHVYMYLLDLVITFILMKKYFFKPKTRLIEGGCVVLHLDCSPTSERALCYKQGNKLKNNTVVQNISTFIELRIN